jgi:predicted anti-sigma-YlaC factor YlaD
MIENDDNSTCAAFQGQLADLIGSGEDAASHPHLQTCTLCRALLTDLETIAEAARQLFPVADPPDTLWEHIDSAIRNETKSSSEPGLPGTNEIGTSNSDLSVEPA